MKLTELGWNESLQNYFEEYKQTDYTFGRVVLEHKNVYQVITENGEFLSEVSGKYRYHALSREDYPAVGDWVVLSERLQEGKATIHATLPRFSKFSRKIAGLTTEEQIVAVNVDTVFLVQSLNQDLNPRRLERYLLMAWESGANPVVVLTKADLCENIAAFTGEVESVAFGVPVHVISVVSGLGLAELSTYFAPGKTVALLGSSGAGKSTLTNYLLGEAKQLVQNIREEDDKGRHTTTHRELIQLPTGGLVIDTPGMRELQLWEAESGLSYSFQDIEALAQQCKFRDCTHQKEPNCAVQHAIQIGLLEKERLQSYNKLQKELAYLERKNDKRAQLAEKEKWKKIQASVPKTKKR
ncbi:ribosome small subunit-dependent GTPase A [Caldibacillus lycopersici]|uniref:Small ribosomal subunit biogenesis GTPase RsgA n=1 Tax=Perspicuibacillus lycopersici TaxID=1325689 RepID=A0AAE3IRE5_9BACI|nr:ribosome small subunit-dependent GTPase A [Perspicuibacillus lycopersici]MCU9612021.1 ribosome small subunit-dependent GTPase A [Perspicuibacillus lycopersici]